MDKDLQYYLDHPDEVPSDPAVLAQMHDALLGSTVAEEQPEKTSAEKDVKPEAAASSGEEGTKGAPTEGKQQEQEGDIAMPSGKGTIPYAVLKTERERRQAAEAAVAELSGKMEEIQQQLAKGTEKGDAKAADLGADALSTMTPEELDALRADFPVFGKVIDNLMGTIGKLTKEVESLQTTEQTREADMQRSVAVTVQEHIDNEPVLLHLQSKDPALFAKAVEIDNALRGDARFPDMASRFAKVAQTMENLFGPFDGVAKKAAQDPAPAPSVDKEVARKAVLEKVAATKATPKSLSDVPAGEAPESDELASLENLSAVELSDRLLKMTPDQRASFLNRF